MSATKPGKPSKPGKHRAPRKPIVSARPLSAAALSVLTAASLAATTGGVASAASQRQEKIHDALEVARDQKGDEYEYGANGPHQFDCSGLIQYSYGKAGIDMPRTSGEQADRARRIAREDMRKGDLMVFHDGGDVYHIGIFGGWNGNKRRWVLHAPNESEDVGSDLVWTGQWYAATMRGA